MRILPVISYGAVFVELVGCAFGIVVSVLDWRRARRQIRRAARPQALPIAKVVKVVRRG